MTVPTESRDGFSPSGVALIGDSIYCNGSASPGQYLLINGWYAGGGIAVSKFALSIRHSNMANMLFIDGHVDRIGILDCFKQKFYSVANDNGDMLYGNP